ncbi:copper resistance CopC/CopD family protein [Streptomyces sp. NPDC056222]|uniref:copper resistance CopC/CopD family protein n=1 Tax=Streptomyces sp. NPDC056222 TaxID=3345749 RepID=UPI0035DEB11F
MLLLAGAGTASAHAKVSSTSPAGGAVVGAAPAEVTIDFSEGMALGEGAVRVFAPDGRRVDTGPVERVRGADDTARVRLRAGLGEGTYTVSWKAVSADSHPISGAFAFSVGKASATQVVLPDRKPGSGSAAVLYDIARFFELAAYALAIGTAAFVLVCLPGSTPLGPLKALLICAGSVLLAAALVQLLLRAPYESGDGVRMALSPSALKMTVGTDPGQALILRMLLTLAAGALWGILSRLRRGALRMTYRPVCLGVAALVAVGMATTWALTGHAASGPQSPAAVVVSVVHSVAMAVWLGGLAALATTLLRAKSANRSHSAAVGRFSRMAFAAVAGLVLTGAYQSWRQIGSLNALVSTSFGQLLLLKLCGVLAMLGAAGMARSYSARVRGAAGEGHGLVGAAPQQDGVAAPLTALRRSTALEVGAAVVVLVLTTALTGTEPGRTAAGDAATVAAASATPAGTAFAEIPFDTGSGGGRGKVLLTIDPGLSGVNTVTAVVYGPDGALAVVPEIRVSLTLPAKDLGPLDVEMTDVGGYWASKDFPLPLPGAWRASVTVRTSDIDQATTATTVRISE